MKEKIRWGILSTGSISKQFARGLRMVADAELLAVGSRAKSSAEAFGREFGVARCYGSYGELAADPDVDAIYVSTPHPFHKENTILCLEKGKAVLCEKPFSMNAKEAEEMVAVARRKKVFLMEAMWTRYLPAICEARRLLRANAIGDIRLLQADFGFRAPYNPQSRLFAPELGGGALLDVGVYVVSFASMVFGKAREITGFAHLGGTGVDELCSLVLKHNGGGMASLSAAISTTTPHEANLLGTEGRLRIHAPFFKAERISLIRPGKAEEIFDFPIVGNGYNYEAVEVGRCLREDLLESETLPLDETLEIMGTMDEARKQWGLKYPME